MPPKHDLLKSLSHYAAPGLTTAPNVTSARRHWRWITVIGVAAAALAGAFAMRPDPHDAPAARPAPMSKVAALPANTGKLEVAGFVTARRTATISARTIGVIDTLLVNEGDTVRRNQVIARLDDARARIEAEQSEASARLAVIRVRQAEVALTEAERVLQRQSALVANHFSSPAVLSNVETDVQLKRAALDIARQELTVATIEARRYQLLLSEYVIRAPFDGVVIARNAQEGETIAPTSAGGGFTRTGICTIADTDSLEIEVDINEQNIDQVQPRQAVRIQTSGSSAKTLVGEVLKLEPAADRAKATVKARIRILESQARLLPGMSVRVTFL
jgi:RND family efflux transporter MFP subunit